MAVPLSADNRGTMPDAKPPDKPIPYAWVGLEETESHFANVFVAQYSPAGEFTITFGELVQPLLAGTPEERSEQLRRVPFVPIRTVARIVLNEQRVRELADLLPKLADSYRNQRERPK